jgi:hypothetical protein
MIPLESVILSEGVHSFIVNAAVEGPAASPLVGAPT